MIDKKAAEKAFLDYAADYDISDVMVSSKILHTMKVADFAEQIAASIGLSGEQSFAYLLGLLHDFGRFEQIRRYGTFSDIHSVDHAELGADILFKENKIALFTDAGLEQKDLELTETAIRQHNKLVLPKDLDDRTRTFCNILRDADKVDILRVVDELSLKERVGKRADILIEKKEASREVMECIKNHRCVPRGLVESGFELHLSHICMVFELVYEKSRSLVREQGHVSHLLALRDEQGKWIWNEREREQLNLLKEELINWCL